MRRNNWVEGMYQIIIFIFCRRRTDCYSARLQWTHLLPMCEAVNESSCDIKEHHSNYYYSVINLPINNSSTLNQSFQQHLYFEHDNMR